MGMKSPAYRCGQHDLKGKKVKRLGCGCCTMYNFKDSYKEKIDKKTMKMYCYEGNDK